MIKIIKVSDFSETPGGRYYTDGPASGQEYRDTVLIPAIDENSKIKVDLSGVFIYPPSFLEEAFAGLIRAYCKDIRDVVELYASDTEYETYVQEAKRYMQEAASKLSK